MKRNLSRFNKEPTYNYWLNWVIALLFRIETDYLGIIQIIWNLV
jgi:hypothetical protein